MVEITYGCAKQDLIAWQLRFRGMRVIVIVGLLLLLLIVSSERQAMLRARSSAGYGFILRSSVDDPNNRFKPANDPILQVTIQPVCGRRTTRAHSQGIGES